MSQAQFECFMEAQIAAIVASNLEPETWVAQFGESFRAEWIATH